MQPSFRRALPVLVAIAWLFGTWQVVLGGHDIGDMLQWGIPEEYRGQITGIAVAVWFVGMLLAIVIADVVYARLFLRRIDRSKLHWSRLHNRYGQFICAVCGGTFILPPESLSDEDCAYCGDCGHRIAPYGEMKRRSAEIRIPLPSGLGHKA